VGWSDVTGPVENQLLTPISFDRLRLHAAKPQFDKRGLEPLLSRLYNSLEDFGMERRLRPATVTATATVTTTSTPQHV
jgi:hypothetical protein